jgi:hypothetical protein
MADSDELIPAEEAITPRALQTPRAAGVAGILFALLFGVTVVLLRKVVPSNPYAAGTWLTHSSNRRELTFALALVPFCGIFFLWFMGAVRARIADAEDKFFSTVFMGSGLLFVAMLFVFASMFGALISIAGLHHGRPPTDIWQLGRAVTFRLAAVYAVKMGAVFMIASSTIALRLRIHSRFVAVAGYAAALLLLFASSTLPWLQLVFPIWVLLVSVNILVLSYRNVI